MSHASVPGHASRPLLILVNSMDEQTRGHLLESVANEYRVWLFTDQEPTWQLPHIVGHTVVDTLDAPMMTTAARPLSPNAVVCWDETRLLAAARVAKGLRLPGLDPDAVRMCRDKHLTREAVEAAGGPQPVSTKVSTLAEARSAAERIGYPVVVKPRAMVGSNGVGLARSEQELDAVFPTTRALIMDEVRERFAKPVLIEEYVDGPEISVDTLLWDGEVTPIYVARKELSPPPNFEEIGHSVDRADPILNDPALIEALSLVHQAVGLTRAWTHSEWRLTARGPRLVEINARSGGDFISYLGALATGADAGSAAARLALGQRPVPGVAEHRAAAVRFLYPDAETVVGRVTIDHERLPEAVKVARVLAEPGHVLELPPASHTGRYAMLVVTGESAQECGRTLDSAAGAVHLDPAEPVAVDR